MQNHATDNHYPKETYRLLVDIEPRHFWFQGRNHILNAFIRSIILRVRDVSFLEVGCGTGYVLSFLESLGFRVAGVDMHREALRYAHKRTHGSLYCGNVEDVALSQFHCVGAFDVLEHVGNEGEFLRACRRLLEPGGYLFLMLPAHTYLWSTIDEVAGHKRRYDSKYIVKLLKKERFQVLRISYYGLFYYMPLLLHKLYLRSFPLKTQREQYQVLRSSLSVPLYPLNVLFGLFMLLESVLLRFMNIPFGSSLIVCAQKDGTKYESV